MGPTLRGTVKTEIFKGWKISASASCRDSGFDLVPMNEGGTVKTERIFSGWSLFSSHILGKSLYAELDRQQKVILVPWKSTNSLSVSTRLSSVMITGLD